MTTQGIDCLSTLPHQQIPCAERHRGSLLRFGLRCDEAHGRSQSGLHNCLGIGRIVLLPLHERLYIPWRDQPDLMTQRSDRTRPMVRSRAGFHCHDAAWLRREEFQNLSTGELPPENHRSIRRRAVRLKHVLGQVQPDDANLFHGRPLRSGSDTTTLAQWMPSGASTPSVMESMHTSVIAEQPSLWRRGAERRKAQVTSFGCDLPETSPPSSLMNRAGSSNPARLL